MLAFFLFWLVHLPLTFFRPYQLKKFFWFKAIVMLPAIWGLFIFCMVNTKGNIGIGHLAQTTKVHNNGWGWFFVYSINAGMGNTATLITNQPDIVSSLPNPSELNMTYVPPMAGADLLA